MLRCASSGEPMVERRCTASTNSCLSMAYPFRGGLDSTSHCAKGRVLLSTRSMKRSRLRLTSPIVFSSNITGTGSRATHPTRAQGPQSTETSSPAVLFLTRQPSPAPPRDRNISASSSWPKTGSACSPSARLVVSTSIRPFSFLVISQYANPGARPGGCVASASVNNSRPFSLLPFPLSGGVPSFLCHRGPPALRLNRELVFFLEDFVAMLL